jgi:tellurite methyltransferase
MKLKDYWDNFYQKRKAPEKSSDFSKFCYKYFCKYNKIIYDVGCGNARDTFFFLKKKINCIGIDSSKKVIYNLKKNNYEFKNNFYNADYTKLNYDKFSKKKYSIYSRFSLHAINSTAESRFLKILENSINLEYVMIECRTIYDELYGKGKKIGKNQFILGHYRRFIDPKDLLSRIKKKFIIKFFNISNNFAKYNKENPIVLRIILKKNILNPII